jgi:hypothetical protein
MKTPRKKIAFRTPRRASKTPVKPASKAKMHEPEESGGKDLSSPGKENVLRYKQVLGELRMKEKSLVESYKRENEYLRSLKSDTLLYKKLIGFDIVEAGEGYEITHEVSSNGALRFIKFMLTPQEDSYVYKLVDHRNIDLPDYLETEIEFDRSQIMTFFFKVMEASITKRDNL